MNKKELKEWYKACDFIKKEMQFYSFQDFLNEMEYIKFYFENSNYDIRQLYQWYVFANVNVSNKQKNLIWDYITNNNIFKDNTKGI